MTSDLARKLAEALWQSQWLRGTDAEFVMKEIAALLDRAGLAEALDHSYTAGIKKAAELNDRYRAALEQIRGFPIRSDKPYTLMDAVEAAREALRDE